MASWETELTIGIAFGPFRLFIQDSSFEEQHKMAIRGS